MILGAAILLSLGPITLHLTARESNPFLFNLINNVIQAALVALFLVFSRKRYFVDFFRTQDQEHHALQDESSIPELSRFHLHLASFLTSKRGLAEQTTVVRVNTSRICNPVDWYRIPLLWAAIGTMDYGFLAWATSYVETAIATTVFELWPLMLVFGLVRSERVDQLYRSPSSVSIKKNRSSKEQLLLVVFASVGIIFMLSSQSRDGIISFRELFSYSGIAGIALALISACLASLSVVGTLAYGSYCTME